VRGRAGQDTKQRDVLVRGAGSAGARRVVFALLMLTAACVQPPRMMIPTPHGNVFADDSQAAQELAEMLIDLQPRVRELLPGDRDRITDVWRGSALLPEDLRNRQGVVALTELSSGRIVIGGGAFGVGDDFLLAHELVHALMDDSWDPLPAVMKEGLCDAIACRAVPGQAAQVRALRMFSARFAFGEQQLDLAVTEPSFGARLGVPLRVAASDVSRRDPHDALALGGRGVRLHDELHDEDVLYGYGLLLVERVIERIGIVGLHELCIRARSEGRSLLTLVDVLAAAGLDDSALAWRAALADAVGPAELRALTEQLGERLADAVVTNLRYRYADFSAQEFLERAGASLRLRGGSTELPLAQLPQLAAQVAAAWDAAPPLALRPGETQVHGDRDGVHLGLFGNEDELNECTLQWVRLPASTLDSSQALSVALSDASIVPESAEVEACLRFRRGENGVSLVSSRPGGFDQYRVEVHGVVVADLAWGLNVDVQRDSHGWSVITSRLDPSLQVGEAVLFGPDANVLVSMRASDGAVGEFRYPLAIPLNR